MTSEAPFDELCREGLDQLHERREGISNSWAWNDAVVTEFPMWLPNQQQLWTYMQTAWGLDINPADPADIYESRIQRPSSIRWQASLETTALASRGKAHHNQLATRVDPVVTQFLEYIVESLVAVPEYTVRPKALSEID